MKNTNTLRGVKDTPPRPGDKPTPSTDQKVDDSASIKDASHFELMIKQGNEVTSISKAISENKAMQSALLQEKAGLKNLIKPKSRANRKLKLSTENNKIASEERKLIKLKIMEVDNQLILLKDQLAAMSKNLMNSYNSARKGIKREQLKNKAFSKAYIQRNRRFIKSRLINAINESINSKNREPLIQLQKLSLDDTDAGVAQFNESFSDFLEDHDHTTYVLCSGIAKTDLYRKSRKALASWDPAVSDALPLSTDIWDEEEDEQK